jgi:alpha-L-fucosidase
MKEDGLHIRAMMAQRLQDNRKWENPVVLRITNVKPAFAPPDVRTVSSSADVAGHAEVLTGDLVDMAGASSLEVGFEYRAMRGEDVHANTEPWTATPLQTATHTGQFTFSLEGLPSGPYEFHAIVKHPLLTLYGADTKMQR